MRKFYETLYSLHIEKTAEIGEKSESNEQIGTIKANV
jgi:hypothetical protein